MVAGFQREFQMNMVRLASLLFFVCGVVISLNSHAEEDEEGEAEVARQAQYYDLQPAFVANYGSSSKKLKYIKADVSLRLMGADAVSAVQSHEPIVRHEIVMLLSRQTEESMSAPGSQEAIRMEALELAREALTKETGNSQIDDLLFTSFVVQR